MQYEFRTNNNNSRWSGNVPPIKIFIVRESEAEVREDDANLCAVGQEELATDVSGEQIRFVHLSTWR